MWIHERTQARILALTRCSTTTYTCRTANTCLHARVYSRSHVRSFVRSLARVLVHVHATRCHEYTHLHAYLHAYRYMTRATDTCKRSTSLSLSLILPLFFFRTLFRSRPLPLNRSFFLFRSHPYAFSSSIPLLFPTSRPPPLSTPSRIFYSFFLSLSLSLSPIRSLSSSMPSSHSSLNSSPSLSVSPKLLPLSLATAYTVETAQAAEGHRSQLWTYLDRQEVKCGPPLPGVLVVGAEPRSFYRSDATKMTIRRWRSERLSLRLPPISSSRAEISPE